MCSASVTVIVMVFAGSAVAFSLIFLYKCLLGLAVGHFVAFGLLFCERIAWRLGAYRFLIAKEPRFCDRFACRLVKICGGSRVDAES